MNKHQNLQMNKIQKLQKYLAREERCSKRHNALMWAMSMIDDQSTEYPGVLKNLLIVNYLIDQTVAQVIDLCTTKEDDSATLSQ